MLTGKVRLSAKCVFDLDDQVIHRGRRDFRLSAVEYRILLELTRSWAEHPNRPVGSRDLIRQIWGNSTTGSPSNLKNYINRIRCHLGERELIVTLHGLGYMLVPKLKVSKPEHA